jgi:hypothetical protein
MIVFFGALSSFPLGLREWLPWMRERLACGSTFEEAACTASCIFSASALDVNR